MPIPYGHTKKGRAEHWIRKDAKRNYRYSTRQIAEEVFFQSWSSPGDRSAVLSAIADIRANNFLIVTKQGKGINTRWIFKDKVQP